MLPRDHTAALQRLGDDDVVDVVGFDARARATTAPTAISARRNASTSISDPLRARPIGVRAAATMTASVTTTPEHGNLAFGSGCYVSVAETGNDPPVTDTSTATR